MKKIIFILAVVFSFISCCTKSFDGITIPYKCENTENNLHKTIGYHSEYFEDIKYIIYEDSTLIYRDCKWTDSIEVIHYKYIPDMRINHLDYVCIDSAKYNNIVWNDVVDYSENYDGHNGKDAYYSRIFYNDITRNIVCILHFARSYDCEKPGIFMVNTPITIEEYIKQNKKFNMEIYR